MRSRGIRNSQTLLLVGVWVNRNWILGNWIKEVETRSRGHARVHWVGSVFAQKHFWEKLIKFPHTTDFPEYHAHSTIAYLKSGKGKQYIENFSNRSFEVFPTRFVYSKSDGQRIQAGVAMRNQLR